MDSEKRKLFVDGLELVGTRWNSLEPRSNPWSADPVILHDREVSAWEGHDDMPEIGSWEAMFPMFVFQSLFRGLTQLGGPCLVLPLYKTSQKISNHNHTIYHLIRIYVYIYISIIYHWTPIVYGAWLTLPTLISKKEPPEVSALPGLRSEMAPRKLCEAGLSSRWRVCVRG